MQIKRISILTGTGCDIINIITDLPKATWPFEKFGGKQNFLIQCVAGKGESYVQKHFPEIPYTVTLS